MNHLITRVGASDLADLLALMRAYTDFYETSPTDRELLTMSETLLSDPTHEGVQLIARDTNGVASGFATVFWSWATTIASRIGVMNDLYVAPHARGSGAAEGLIAACRAECSAHGARRMEWQTAPDNFRAQTVYARVGGVREQWVDYWLTP